MRLVKKILEMVIFFFSGVLIRLVFSMQLNWRYNLIILFGVIAVIAYVSITQVIEQENKKIIDIFKETFKDENNK